MGRGVFFAVVTDESASFTGCVHREFRGPVVDPIPMADFFWTSTNGDGTWRRKPKAEGVGRRSRRSRITVDVHSVRQPSCMGTAVTASPICRHFEYRRLVTVEGSSKFDAAATVLRDRSEAGSIFESRPKGMVGMERRSHSG